MLSGREIGIEEQTAKLHAEMAVWAYADLMASSLEMTTIDKHYAHVAGRSSWRRLRNPKCVGL